jgi:hypothetical protein
MKKALALTSAVMMFSCSQKFSGGTSTAVGCYSNSGQSIGASNVVPITMGCGYVNEPCVAVKVCEHGSATNCVTIDHILLDSGSYGLRLFSCAVSGLNLTQQTGGPTITAKTTSGSTSLTSLGGVTSGERFASGQTITGTGIPAGTTVASTTIVGNFVTGITMSQAATATGTGVSLTITGDVAECVHYADGTADWGPVQLADVYIGGKTISNQTIQVIDASYNSVPSSCSGAESNPQAAGFNGILGVGLVQYDCPSCNTGSLTAGYYSCGTSGCAGYAAPNSVQTSNPIMALSSTYNNGVAISTQSVPSIYGANGVTGNLIFGVDTVAGVPNVNSPCDGTSGDCGNSASGTTAFAATASLTFNTTFPSTGTDAHIFANSFVDSGSNLWDFANDYMNSPVTRCNDGFYCPGSPVSLSATPGGGTAVPFTLIDADTANYGYSSFNTLGAYFDVTNDSFDWGMPFYFGRNIFHVYTGKSSTNVGSGPAWAW